MRKSPELYDKVLNGYFPPSVREQALDELCNMKSREATKLLNMLANGGVLPPDLKQKVLECVARRKT